MITGITSLKVGGFHMYKRTVLLYIVTMLFLAGCTTGKAKLSEEIEVLREENKELHENTKQLEDEVKSYKSTLKEYAKEIYLFKDIIDKYQAKGYQNDFNIHKEGFFIKPEFTSRDAISIDTIKNIMGKPKNSREYIEVAHCGCKETELTYDNASFTFQGNSLKWFTLRDSKLVTERGITIGATREEVIEAYGQDLLVYGNNEISYGEKTGIRFSFKDDILKEISIWYM